MKTALMTFAIGDAFKQLSQLTHPYMQAYANKVGAEFVNITDMRLAKTRPVWEKLRIYDLFDTYDRIIYIDTDALIRPDCPNLLEVVPPNKFGAWNQGAYWDASPAFYAAHKAYNIPAPTYAGRYYNIGIFVASKEHKSSFVYPAIECDIPHEWEQGYVNVMLLQNKVETFDLPIAYNRFDDRRNFLPGRRPDAYIVHYAVRDMKTRARLIAQDLSEWRNKGLLK